MKRRSPGWAIAIRWLDLAGNAHLDRLRKGDEEPSCPEAACVVDTFAAPHGREWVGSKERADELVAQWRAIGVEAGAIPVPSRRRGSAIAGVVPA